MSDRSGSNNSVGHESLDYPIAKYKKEWALWSPPVDPIKIYREDYLKSRSTCTTAANVSAGLAAIAAIASTFQFAMMSRSLLQS